EFTQRYKCKKAQRLWAFLLPKPKPMRRITLLKNTNATHGCRFHGSKKNLFFFQFVFKHLLKLFNLGCDNIRAVGSVTIQVVVVLVIVFGFVEHTERRD